MQTRRDQLAAYRYSVRRVMTALMGSDPEQAEQPMRRVASATLAGILVAVLGLTGAGFYGKVRGGSPSAWQRTDVLIVERETGSRYVWTGSELRPVLNYTSARLLLQQPEVHTVKVSRSAIAGARRGAAVGIAGAPDSLPDARHVVRTPWSVCATRRGNDTVSTLIIGADVGGEPLGDDSLLVRSGGELFLVWRGKRLAATPSDLRSLGLDDQRALAVPAAWMNAVPAGPDLVPPTIDGVGGTGTEVGGRRTRIGDVVRATSAAGVQWYASLADGLSPISETQALLLTGSHGAALVDATTADVNVSRNSQQRLEPEEMPALRPKLAPVAQSSPLCVQAVAGDGAVSESPLVSLGGDLGAPSPVGQDGTASAQHADQLVIEPGHVAVVSVLTSGGDSAPGMFLITDAGLRFGVPTADVAAWLGYSSVRPLSIPSQLLALVPQGPALDPASARNTLTAVP